MNKGSQNIAIIGSGYVGMSLAILLSQNNTVNLYDLDEGRLRKIDQRVSPIKDDLIDEYLSTKKLELFTKNSFKEAVNNVDIIVVATPTDYDDTKNFFNTDSVDETVKEALKINARGNLRGLTLTKYKIVKGGSNPGTTFDHIIYVLYGLPYIECESVLAHEFAHVWLNEKFIESTPPVIEGFCNLVSSEVLEKEKSKLASILLDNLQNNTSLAYGVGYRKMKANLAQKNWPQLLAEMKSKSKPPKL